MVVVFCGGGFEGGRGERSEKRERVRER